MILAGIFDNPILMVIAAAGAVSLIAYLVLDSFFHDTPEDEKLERIKALAAGEKPSAGGARMDSVTTMLENMTPGLADMVKPKKEKEVNKLQDALNFAGFRRESALTVFLGVKLICAAIALFVGGGATLLQMGLTPKAIAYAAVVAAIGYFLPGMVVHQIGKSRQQKIFLALPDTLDLLVVCVEAGLGLDQAMRKVAEELYSTYPLMAEEFQICNFQLQMGKTRNEVLHNLGQRTGVDDLKSLASILIQADKFGSSVGQALRVQSDAMRTRRRQIAEEKAAKTAVQLLFPLVLFIFPGVFTVLVGPAAITMVRQLFTTMNPD